MKLKITLAIIALTSWSSGLHAQIHLGLKAGTNLATYSVSEEDFTDYGIMPALYIGIPVGIPVTDKLWICPEAALIGHGARLTSEYEFLGLFTASIEANTRVMNLDIPVNVKYMVTENIFVMAGPYIGYALTGRLKGTTTTTTTDIITGEVVTETEEIDEKIEDEDWDGFNRTDYGVNVGAGYMASVGTGSVIINAGYSLGLADVSDDDPDEAQVYNRGIQITIGYLFGFGE